MTEAGAEALHAMAVQDLQTRLELAMQSLADARANVLSLTGCILRLYIDVTSLH
jgi:hypothetical protein